VTARIETLSGALLRRLPPQELAPGTVRVAWDGRTDTGSPVYSGRYVARISAVNELGTVSLAVAFLVRRSGAGGAARR
jgi:flagellar hook assembly protein FlgD